MQRLSPRGTIWFGSLCEVLKAPCFRMQTCHGLGRGEGEREDGQGLRRDEGKKGGDDPPNPIIFLFCSRNFLLFLDSAAVPSSLIHNPQTATATMNDDDAGSHMQDGRMFLSPPDPLLHLLTEMPLIRPDPSLSS